MRWSATGSGVRWMGWSATGSGARWTGSRAWPVYRSCTTSLNEWGRKDPSTTEKESYVNKVNQKAELDLNDMVALPYPKKSELGMVGGPLPVIRGGKAFYVVSVI